METPSMSMTTVNNTLPRVPTPPKKNCYFFLETPSRMLRKKHYMKLIAVFLGNVDKNLCFSTDP